jgi:uncharacterized protein
MNCSSTASRPIAAEPSDTGCPVPYLDRVALDFPELVIVGGHIGHPWTNEMIGVVWKHDNVYLDTSAYLPRYYPAELAHVMNTYGRGKVMFGTNWPQLTHERALSQVDQLGLTVCVPRTMSPALTGAFARCARPRDPTVRLS